MIAFEQVGDIDHHIKNNVVAATVVQGTALHGMAQLEQINFSQPVTLFKRSKGMELLEGRQLTCGACLLLLEEGANQGKGPVEDRK